MLFFLKLNNRYGGKMLTVTSVLLLALAVAAPVLHAQDRDDINGRRRSNQGLNRLSRPSRSRARNVNRLPITWISTLTFAPQSAIRSVAGMLPSPEQQRTPCPMSRPSTGARCASVFGKHCGILILNSINLSSIEASSGGNIIRFSGSSFTEIAPNLPAARKLSYSIAGRSFEGGFDKRCCRQC